MTESTDWVEKVRKLLAMAEDPAASEAEREAFRDKAYDLMAKYNIEAAHLAATDPSRAKEDPVIYVVGSPIGVGAKTYSREWVKLGIEIAKAFGLVGLFQGSRHGSAIDLGVAGHKSDVERAMLLWDSLQRQAGLALAAHTASIDVWSQFTGMEKYKERRSFIVGYAEHIGSRLRAIYRKAAEESKTPGTDLVLRDRSKVVATWVEHNLRVGKARGGRSYGYGGRNAGASAAATALLGQTDLSGSATSKPALGG